MWIWVYSIREVCKSNTACCIRFAVMRPVVVVSNNRANRHSTVITVVPPSTKIYRKQNLPTHVLISSYKTEGLDQHSVALCEQVTALNYDRIIEHMGKVDEETLGRITEGIQVQVNVFDR